MQEIRATTSFRLSSAEILDRFQRDDRPLRDGLRGIFRRRRVRVRREVHGHALPDQQQPPDEGGRHQDTEERSAREVVTPVASLIWVKSSARG